MLRTAVLLATFLPAVASAQSVTPSQILFTGDSTHSPAALLAVAALPSGRALTQKDIEDAMGRLADTGLFTDISFTVSNSVLTFTLTPQPSAALLPVLYANFLLWPPDQLTPLVHQRVPLFDGSLPTTGTLQQSVQQALTDLLNARLPAPTGQVESILSADKHVVFSIATPPVLIHQVTVASVSPTASRTVDQVRAAFASTPYDPHSQAAVRERLEVAYQDLGFLDSTIDPPTQSQPVVEPARILVDLATTVHEGGQYRVSSIQPPETTLIPRPDLERALTLKPGDPAARIELLSTIERLKSAFTHRGYLDVQITPQPQKNALVHSVAYTFALNPGDVYHLASLRVANCTDQQQKDFESRWKLAPGAVFDAAYPYAFLAVDAPAIQSFQGYTIDFKILPDRTAHTVQVTAVFVKKA